MPFTREHTDARARITIAGWPGGRAHAAGIGGAGSVAVDGPAAATEWLALLDAGEYEASWKQAASAFRDAVTPAVWTESVTNARGSLEPFGDRELISSQQLTDPPGAPPGDYVILQYRTDVAGDRTVVETVVPMREGDAWKVSGYFVNPE